MDVLRPDAQPSRPRRRDAVRAQAKYTAWRARSDESVDRACHTRRSIRTASLCEATDGRVQIARGQSAPAPQQARFRRMSDEANRTNAFDYARPLTAEELDRGWHCVWAGGK